jgi:hypothetical protein
MAREADRLVLPGSQWQLSDIKEFALGEIRMHILDGYGYSMLIGSL